MNDYYNKPRDSILISIDWSRGEWVCPLSFYWSFIKFNDYYYYYYHFHYYYIHNIATFFKIAFSSKQYWMISSLF